jgi:hypothetical protein
MHNAPRVLEAAGNRPERCTIGMQLNFNGPQGMHLKRTTARKAERHKDPWAPRDHRNKQLLANQRAFQGVQNRRGAAARAALLSHLPGASSGCLGQSREQGPRNRRLAGPSDSAAPIKESHLLLPAAGRASRGLHGGSPDRLRMATNTRQTERGEVVVVARSGKYPHDTFMMMSELLSPSIHRAHHQGEGRPLTKFVHEQHQRADCRANSCRWWGQTHRQEDGNSGKG